MHKTLFCLGEVFFFFRSERDQIMPYKEWSTIIHLLYLIFNGDSNLVTGDSNYL